MDELRIAGLVRGEVDHFFDRLENVGRLHHDHCIAVLQLLPEAERAQFLLKSQENGFEFLESLVDQTFEIVNKVVDANIKK